MLCTSFMKFTKMTPNVTFPYLKTTPQNKSIFWKWSPGKLANRHSQVKKMTSPLVPQTFFSWHLPTGRWVQGGLIFQERPNTLLLSSRYEPDAWVVPMCFNFQRRVTINMQDDKMCWYKTNPPTLQAVD